ncbi:Phosphopantetheine adenylyltransferase [Desulfurobacterium thermolithotrophum DSM 11699]|uniref:Phosphopantetheine adenylyltransferase n=1 Tax=Desulfurobacterium thermolithotrophum (strain DSM 11699 / BSA) TaxID=868864 RepID=F0S3H3_DESTD|nr:pantetheine-phosphate adenylyltransferase [Desulfurobacterium thermolithotrophum]ADY73395.1 Phosphopantetheine adenylyltransferase [Desulfurobacterium thermolithotrophum DSM 11699]
MIKKAIYPGTFDPVTLGHIDIVRRGIELFQELIIGIAENPKKEPLFTLEERKKMFEESLKEVGLYEKVKVKTFNSLLVEFAKKEGAVAILRGIRIISDMDHEFTMASINRKLYPEIETVFLMPSDEYAYLSSSAVREIAFYGGDVSQFVTKCVETKLKEKIELFRKG